MRDLAVEMTAPPMQTPTRTHRKRTASRTRKPLSFLSIQANETFERFDSLFSVSQFLSIFRINLQSDESRWKPDYPSPVWASQ